MRASPQLIKLPEHLRNRYECPHLLAEANETDTVKLSIRTQICLIPKLVFFPIYQKKERHLLWGCNRHCHMQKQLMEFKDEKGRKRAKGEKSHQK